MDGEVSIASEPPLAALMDAVSTLMMIGSVQLKSYTTVVHSTVKTGPDHHVVDSGLEEDKYTLAGLPHPLSPCLSAEA